MNKMTKKMLAMAVAGVFGVATFASAVYVPSAFAQGGRMTSDPTVINSQGQHIAGANVAICQPPAERFGSAGIDVLDEGARRNGSRSEDVSWAQGYAA